MVTGVVVVSLREDRRDEIGRRSTGWRDVEEGHRWKIEENPIVRRRGQIEGSRS
jgi:hypothetical protein